eukprot:1982885-Prymnesium_polylepis.1
MKRRSKRCGLLPPSGLPEHERLLHDVSGHIGAGQMMALMGPSGSGKTTLLSVLAGRIGNGCRIDAGQVTIGGRAPSKQEWRQCGFVFQDDLLLPMLTVRETIEYAARLRLPPSAGDERHTAD